MRVMMMTGGGVLSDQRYHEIVIKRSRRFIMLIGIIN